MKYLYINDMFYVFWPKIKVMSYVNYTFLFFFFWPGMLITFHFMIKKISTEKIGD